MGRGSRKQALRGTTDQRCAENDAHPDFAPTPVAGETAADHERSGSTPAAYIRMQPQKLQNPFIEPLINAVEIARMAPGALSDFTFHLIRADFRRRRLRFRSSGCFRCEHSRQVLPT